MDPAPILDRQVAAPDTSCTGSRFVCVGSSHARRTGEALRRAGHQVTDVNYKAWRPTAANVERMRADLSKLTGRGPSGSPTVVLQMLDSGFYFARSEDGCLVPASRAGDGKFHIVGESVFADKEQQLRTFKLILPILLAVKDCNVVLVPPLPRYLEQSCCVDPTHVANMQLKDYKAKLEEAVYSCKANLKDFAFTSGVRNCRVVASWSCMKKRAAIWAADPVHPTEGAYDDLATVIAACVPSTAAKRVRSPSWGSGGGVGPGGQADKRPRADRNRTDTSSPNPYSGYSRGGRGGPHWHVMSRGGGAGGGGSRGGRPRYRQY